MAALNDLLACDKAVPSTPLSWDMRNEVADLFLIYVKNDPASEKLSRLQYLLNISDSTADDLRGTGDNPLPNVAAGEQEAVF